MTLSTLGSFIKRLETQQVFSSGNNENENDNQNRVPEIQNPRINTWKSKRQVYSYCHSWKNLKHFAKGLEKCKKSNHRHSA